MTRWRSLLRVRVGRERRSRSFLYNGNVVWHQLEKRLKMRINDSRNKVILTNGILDVKYIQPLSSQVHVQHTTQGQQ